MAYLSLSLSMALVGSYVGLSKVLVATFPIFLLAWMRFGIAAVAMAHWWRHSPGEQPLRATDHRWLFLESFLGNFLFSLCMLGGVAATSATAAGVVMASIPAAVALLSRWVLKEAITPRVMVGIACAVAGVALLALAREAAGSDSSSAPWWGYGLLVGAVFCEACYVVIGKKLSATVSPKRISSVINLWGLALMTPIGAWQAMSFDFRAVPPGTWGLLVFYAIAASMWTVWLWMKGLRQVPAARAGVFAVWLPITSAAVGIGLLSEPFSLLHALALTLALVGLLLATWPGRMRRESPKGP